MNVSRGETADWSFAYQQHSKEEEEKKNQPDNQTLVFPVFMFTFDDLMFSFWEGLLFSLN